MTFAAPARWVAPGAVVAAGLAGIGGFAGCDASGSIQGGQLLEPDPCSSPTLSPTWQNLYTCYFGPSGKASCTAQGFCHGGPAGTGAATSGFVCGTTSTSCWQGMTIGQIVCTDGGMAADTGPASPGDAASDASNDAPPDGHASGDGAAGNDAAGDGAGNDVADDGGEVEGGGGGTCSPLITPIVPAGGASDPTTTTLWTALRGATGVGLHNMPYSTGSGFAFSQQDLDRISAWIRAGAKDN